MFVREISRISLLKTDALKRSLIDVVQTYPRLREIKRRMFNGDLHGSAYERIDVDELRHRIPPLTGGGSNSGLPISNASGVALRFLPERPNNLKPTSLSKSEISRLTAGCDTPSILADSVTVPVWTTVLNASIWRKVIFNLVSFCG